LLPPSGKGSSPSPSPARPPVPKPPRPVGPGSDPDDPGTRAHAGAQDSSCAGAGTFVAGMLTGTALALAIGALTYVLSRAEMRSQVLAMKLNGAHGIYPFRPKDSDQAMGADSEYAHLTAAEQQGADAQRTGGADKDGGRGGYGRRAQAGVALAELEASSASAQHSAQHARRAPPPPQHAHYAHHAPRPPPSVNLPPDYAYTPARALASGLPQLEAAGNVDPLAFEAQWVHCQTQPTLSLELRSRAPRPPVQEAIEMALSQAGMVCIAAGAVGDVHKAYYAAQIAPTPPGELLMLELVVAPAIGSRGGVAASATFRSPNAHHMHPLAHHFASILTSVMGGESFR